MGSAQVMVDCASVSLCTVICRGPAVATHQAFQS